MSHTHEDRIADRPPHLCAAYGCPLIGTSTASTSGSSEWWCFAHFGADVGRFQSITTEINRLSWLACAARDVRMHKPGTEASRAAFALIEHELAMHQRKDLLWNRMETRMQWLLRLEASLLAMVQANLPAVAEQLPLPNKNVGNFGKVEFDMPA